MKSSAYARIAAWNVIADQDLPAGTKVTVEDGWITLHPRGGQPTRTPYGPADTISGLYNALTDALQATTHDPH